MKRLVLAACLLAARLLATAPAFAETLTFRLS